MTNIELYINNKLCDVAVNFNVRLNRVLINPGELSTKDAQYSYSINLPTTQKNNEILGFANVEETKGKFNRIYTAQLIVNGVRIFSGNFRLSEASGKGYKGNLYLPAIKTIKDIFGDINLNQNAEYRIPFADFANSISAINNAALLAPQIAIFPYVLYGLLPKVPLNKNANSYSSRTLYDDSVRLGMADIPPSINPLLMLKHIFASQGYELQGTAFNDHKLAQLYQSYKNATDYVQPWNYGFHARIKINGSWSSRYNHRTGGNEYLEKGVNQSNDLGHNIYSCDLFDCTNAQINITEDPGANVLYKEVNDTNGRTWAQTQVRIPSSGFYKVKFNGSINVFNNGPWRTTDNATGVQHVSGDGDKHVNNFNYRVYELKLLRDRKQSDFGLSGAKLDGVFYETNQPQSQDFNVVPKYFPQVTGAGQINFIDQRQNNKFLLGYGFGCSDGYRLGLPTTFGGTATNVFYNPRDITRRFTQIEVAKPGQSLDPSIEEVNRIGLKNLGYWKYGRIGTFDNEGDNPDLDIDYSGGTKITGKVLDGDGNPVAPDAGNLTTRTQDFALSNSFGAPYYSEGWEISDFIDLRSFKNLKFSGHIFASDLAAALNYYDANKNLIAVGILADPDDPTDYSDEPITGIAGAVFCRVSAEIGTLVITGESSADDNIILERFPLQRFFSYIINGGGTYEGYVYIYETGATAPTKIVPFVGGVAEFTTSEFATAPLITLYLKTPNFNVDGTLTIDRVINDTSETVIGWEVTDKYAIDIINSPANTVSRSNEWTGSGQVNAIVWLEAGELLTVASVSEEGWYRRNGMHSTQGWTNHEVSFDLEIEPFRTDDAWLKVDYAGHGTQQMDWNDAPNFDVDSIDMVGFLPADMKTNDYIDNFVKAFNLRLTQVATNVFALDVKQSSSAATTLSIPLDGIASINDRLNTTLNLPYSYKLGFTVSTDEEGYFMTNDDGGGEYFTGAISDTSVEQKSSFSFNWFKTITKTTTGGNIQIQLPVISKHEAWIEATPYAEAMAKRYTTLAMRFWYLNGILPGDYNINGVAMNLAQVSNEIAGESILDYKNKPHTILTNYYTLIGIGSESHYTEAEAYLTPTQYQNLDGSLMVKFNSDLYYAAELEAYDPTNKNKTKLKLIRRI